MCGIVGIFYRKSFKRDDVNISKSIDSMVHRGPDDKGTTKFELVSGFLEFGHTRLSIIDLSRNGRQPMQYSNERFTITFNGEIYNYKELRAELNKLGYIFETESDTEVLLACWAEWKENCLKKLIGMFAFAIYDKKYNKLFCVRDAFGIKPLYFSYSHDTFSFSSEIPSLLNLIPNKPGLNFKYIYDYLTFGDYDRDENKETFGDGEVYEGVFFNGKIENYEEKSKVFGLKVFWIDDFGDGYLQVIYVLGESFGGHWGSGKKVEGKWSGKKCDPETGETLEFK